MYEYYQHEDIPALAEAHKAALRATQKVTTPIYHFRTKDTGVIRLQTEWKSFKNPWTKDVEYIIAKNSVILWANWISSAFEHIADNRWFFQEWKTTTK